MFDANVEDLARMIFEDKKEHAILEGKYIYMPFITRLTENTPQYLRRYEDRREYIYIFANEEFARFVYNIGK